MAFHIYWPALTCLTLFITVVIVVLLRFGPRLCKTRNVALPDRFDEWDEEESRDQRRVPPA